MTSKSHAGPVPEAAWAADDLARQRGRVEMFNASRPDGLDGWTMDLTQYELMRNHILEMAQDAGREGVLLKDLVATAQAEYETHPAFPKGRLRNYCTFTKVDLEARGLIERMIGSGPRRIRLTARDQHARSSRRQVGGDPELVRRQPEATVPGP